MCISISSVQVAEATLAADERRRDIYGPWQTILDAGVLTGMMSLMQQESGQINLNTFVEKIMNNVFVLCH